MKLNRILLTLAAAVTLLVPARAQERGFRAFIDRIAGPSPELDPEAIYQPQPRFHFALTGDIRKANMDEEKQFQVGVGHFDGYNVVFEEIPARISSSMSSDLDKAVGFQAGYGNLGLALSKKIKGQGKDDYFSFDYLSAGFAVQVQYFNLLQPVTYRYTMGEEGHWAYSDQEGTTENPGNLRTFIVDAFYAFNRRTFAYSAAYKGNLFQRRSAGSWMFGSKLILGDYGIDPAEPIAGWAGKQSLQTSAQVAFGGGYSFNLVPYHRQPTGDRDKGGDPVQPVHLQGVRPWGRRQVRLVPQERDERQTAGQLCRPRRYRVVLQPVHGQPFGQHGQFLLQRKLGDVRRWLDCRRGGHLRPVRAVYRRLAAGNALLEIESY